MKRLICIVLSLFVLGVCTAVNAAETAKNPGPEVIDLKMGVMVLPFTHAKHQKSLNNECFHCHASKVGKIDGWGKETAHKICIACHELEDKGPVQCRQCHDKK